MLKLFRVFDRVVVFLGGLVALCLICIAGFDLSYFLKQIIFYFVTSVSCIFFAREAHRFFSIKDKRKYFSADWFDDLVLLAMILGGLWAFFQWSGDELRNFLTIYWGSLVSIGLFSALVNRLETKVGSSRLKLRPSQIFIFSFAVPILVGTTMLMMPKASLFEMRWVDAFFMATSAVSVTGLGVFDLNQLTFFGQIILLILIQLGGIGMMTLALTFTSLLSGGLGIKDRIFLCEIFSEKRLSEVKSLLVKVCFFTFFIEGVGVLLLYGVRRSLFEKIDSKVLWDSIFHSVSAFCNAGFSLAPKNMMDFSYLSNKGFIVILMILIVLGGLGFPSLANIQKILVSIVKKTNEYRIVTTSTRIILSSSLFLLLFGAFGIWMLESQRGFSDLSNFDSVFNSIFLSVTSRTAGFNLFPTEQISTVSVFFVIFLMWVGGAPMSTAGGIKVTTFFVGLLNVWSHIKGTNKIEVFGRVISQDSVMKAYAVVVTSLGTIFVGTLWLVYLEPNLDANDLLFEVVSAMSTVGLSRGVTYQLSDSSKVVLSMLMFVGRVGTLTFLMAFIRQSRSKRYKLLEDDIIIH